MNLENLEKAVYVKGLTKRYGKGQVVIDQLDMTVEKGTIYGLLGASGCGKTTLLSCIVGRRSITSGEVWVLGGKPGSGESSVPGPRLGYMPQEMALMKQFSIKDALHHFGWIYGMRNEDIKERTAFLKKLLELPSLNSKIKNLSGGQTRRVSLAVALVHNPELLILDEPTVGLDPVLRQKIWHFILELATKHKRTIIITTHYIEEARQAHKIGLMRRGKLLAEDTPERLLRYFNCPNLEDVFLRLSTCQEKKIEINVDASPDQNSNLDVSVGELDRSFPSISMVNRVEEVQPESIVTKNFDIEDFTKRKHKKTPGIFQLLATGHPKALLTKNWFRITRHPGAIIFVFFFPMLELCTFYLSVGGKPQGLKLGIVNDELGNFSSCDEYKNFLGDNYGGKYKLNAENVSHCHFNGLSCVFLDKITDDIALKVPYSDLDLAIKHGKKGKLMGVIYFAGNFSSEFEKRLDMASDTSNETLINSQIAVWMDMSRRQSALIMQKSLLDLHENFIQGLFVQCEVNPKVGSIPVKIYDPVYGNAEGSYAHFMTPGVATTMVFFLAVSVTATIIVVERLDGIWDRTLLAGVTSTEILISHIVLETGVIALQVTEVIVFIFVIFRVPCIGSYLDISLLLFLQGLCGMCGGFLVSVSCNSIRDSNFISMGGFYPVLILSGLLWPIEGMPRLLKMMAVGLPTTQGAIAVRNIMEKGWSLTQGYNYQGFLIPILWIFLFTGLSILIIRFRK